MFEFFLWAMSACRRAETNLVCVLASRWSLIYRSETKEYNKIMFWILLFEFTKIVCQKKSHICKFLQIQEKNSFFWSTLQY